MSAGALRWWWFAGIDIDGSAGGEGYKAEQDSGDENREQHLDC